MSAVWQDMPVFISSTFRDMHGERDHLRRVVLPELARRLKEFRRHLVDIDLRWGVDTVGLDEGSKELRVLELCLAEVEFSRPFFVVILGDRYGWVPPPDKMRRAAEEGGYAGDITGKSVTALEIAFGVLDNQPRQARAFFYFRRPLPADAGPGLREADGSPEALALAALKERIQSLLPDRVRTYEATWNAEKGEAEGLEEFGRMVLKDLAGEMEDAAKGHLVHQPATWQQAERQELEEFVEFKARPFLGRERLVAELLEHCLGDGSAVATLVTGEPGMGKSSLFARLYTRLTPRLLRGDRKESELKGEERALLARLKQADVLLLAHAGGISPRSSSSLDALRRWTGELARSLGGADPLEEKASAETVRETFQELLRQAAQTRRVVLLVDALNHMDAEPDWLPSLPANVRLLATSTQGPGRALPPLNEDEIEEVARSVTARWRRELPAAVMAALRARRGPDGALVAGNPLWLELALDELHLMGRDRFAEVADFASLPADAALTAVVARLVESMPTDVAGLYQWLLRRCEQVAGESLARRFAALTALARAGWRESDLAALLADEGGFDGERFARLRLTFKLHLLRRGRHGQLDFFHAQMRAAVAARYLADAGVVKGFHRQVADHLWGLEGTDPMRVRELMYHLAEAGDAERAARFYAEAKDEALEAATATLAGAVRAGRVAWVTGLLDLDGLTEQERMTVAGHFGGALKGTLVNEDTGQEQRALLGAAAWVFHAISQKRGETTRAYLGLAANWEVLGELEMSEGNAIEARRCYEQQAKICFALASDSPDDPEVDRLLSRFRRGAMFNLGGLALAEGDTGRARRCYEEVVQIDRRLAGARPEDLFDRRSLSTSLEMLGYLERQEGNLLAARERYDEAFALHRELAREQPGSTEARRDLSVSHIAQGDLTLLQRGDRAEARHHYAEALAIRRQLAKEQPGSVQASRDIAVCLERLGDVAFQGRDLPSARKAYQECLELRSELARRQPASVEAKRELGLSFSRMSFVSDIPVEQRLVFIRRALDLYRELFRLQPTIAEAAASVARGLLLMAKLLAETGRADEATPFVNECRQILADMQKAGMAVPQELLRFVG